MADPCVNFIRPSGLGLQIFTSDVTRYDGPNLSCLTFNPNSGLNGFIAAVDQAICSLNNTIGNGTISAANVIYSGQVGFCGGDFGFTAPFDMNSIVQQLAGFICDTQNQITNLSLNSFTLGTNFNGGCIGNFGANSTIFQVLTAMATELCTTSTTVGTINGSYVNQGDLSDVSLNNDFVVVGGIRSLAGLVLQMGVSRYFVNGRSYSKALTQGIALTATADNYVDFNNGTGNYVVTAVNIGDPEPAITGIRLWKFTTGTLSVSVEVDRRVYGFVNTTLLLDSAVATVKIADLAVTGAKMENIISAGSFGEASFLKVDYDAKGRITGASTNISLSAPANGQVLLFNGTNWVNATLSFVGGSGTSGRLPRFTASSTLGDSSIRDNGTQSGINANITAGIQVNVATTLANGFYLASSGANAQNYGYYSTVSGGTTNNVGVFGKAFGELAGLVPASSNIGVVGTSGTLGVFETYGGVFGVDAGGGSAGKAVAIYGKAQSSGSGQAIGLLIEAGGGVFGATTRNASAILELVSTTQGFLPPKMNATQGSAITPVDGLMIYVTSTNGTFTSVGFWGYENGSWVKL